jgi:hypothetical protein
MLCALMAGTALAPTAIAEVIDFDEITPADANCCYLTNEYADLGVTFVTTDDGSIWGGLSNGNPGAWFLEGTNGPAFLGFNGASFSATMLFDAPVTELSLDMAPSVGWNTPDDVFILEGYRNGVLVDSVSSPPMGFATWMTVELVGELDEVRMRSTGPSYPNTYGIDNVQWMAVADSGDPGDPGGGDAPPSEMTVEMKIDPWRHHRGHCFVNLLSRGLTRVALLGSETFDAHEVDLESLEAGPGKAGARRYDRMRDVNRDGFPDRIVLFRTRKMGLAFGDTELCVSGATMDGQPFEACDEVETVPFRRHWRHWRRWLP